MQINKDKMSKKDLILASAFELSRKEDFSKVTVEEIAKNAGIGKGTIYQYFKSKEDIVNSVFAWLVDEYAKAIDDLDVTGKSFKEAITLLVNIHLDNMLLASGMVKYLMVDNEKKDMAEHKKFSITYIAKVNEIIDNARVNNEINEISKDVIYSYMIGIMSGACIYNFFINEVDDVNVYKAQIIDCILNGIAK